MNAYPELEIEDPRRIFLVLASEIGGRCSPECHDFLSQMLREKVRSQPGPLRNTMKLAFHPRWYEILSIAIQRAVTSNLIGEQWQLPTVFPMPGIEEILSAADAEVDNSRVR